MIVREKINSSKLDSFVKVVVDLERKILSLGCELHIDCADELLGDGSESKNLWGANIYPQDGEIEFISLINIRPQDNNRSMEIKIPEIRAKVESIIRTLLLFVQRKPRASARG